ncbi:S-adenosyl-L-methionine-dependent methyltransferase [Xylariaceae sp. FL1019]|nr:S-adenosyl-L-methionine-dependent methyltransferase [Xylariaceae sp. FL1019]
MTTMASPSPASPQVPPTSDCVSERTSLTWDSFEERYTWDGGRRYHAYREGRYSLPNDETEQQREELLHILVMDILEQELFLSPMEESPKKVLDLATGTGLWAIEMGDRYPDAEILGLDLSPIQPTSVPPNVSFQIDDIEDTWVHDDDYDLIHMRESSGYMVSTPKVIESAFKHLKPGGWFELQEFHWVAVQEDGTIDPKNPVNQYMDGMCAVGRREGRVICIVPSVGDIMKNCGFVDVQKQTVRVPYGQWHADENQRKRGACFTIVCELLMQPTQGLLASIDWPSERIETLFASMSDMFRNDSIQCYATYYIWSGRRPEENEDVGGKVGGSN